jgi:hypothetical protein
MSLQNYCFKPFTVSVVVRGVAYVATESEQSLLHDRIAIANDQVLRELGKDPRLPIADPEITTTWPANVVRP